ncbi:hypothetical protein SLE2022_029850 [Rubroshorea leprosula]
MVQLGWSLYGVLRSVFLTHSVSPLCGSFLLYCLPASLPALDLSSSSLFTYAYAFVLFLEKENSRLSLDFDIFRFSSVASAGAGFSGIL